MFCDGFFIFVDEYGVVVGEVVGWDVLCYDCDVVGLFNVVEVDWVGF